MKYRRFEDLPAWRAAMELGVKTFAMTATGCLQGDSGLRDQLERAAVSVSNNIAEGFERGTHQELLTFLYYAKGSNGEVRSMLHLLGRLPNLSVRKADLDDLRATAEDLARQLGGWLESLKNSDEKGPRHSNKQTRKATQSSQTQEMFIKKLRRIVDESRADKQHPVDEPP